MPPPPRNVTHLLLDLSRRILSSDDETNFAMHGNLSLQLPPLSHNTTSHTSTSVVVREWVEIDPELEFRGFATNKRLNALTQYYKACYVPRLAKEKHIFQERILELYEQVKDLIGVERYVIDFAVTEDRVYLVELNHWGKTVRIVLSLFSFSFSFSLFHFRSLVRFRFLVLVLVSFSFSFSFSFSSSFSFSFSSP